MSWYPKCYERQIVVSDPPGFTKIVNDDSWRVPYVTCNVGCIHREAFRRLYDSEEHYQYLQNGFDVDGLETICIYCEFAQLQLEGHEQFSYDRLARLHQQAFFDRIYWRESIQKLYDSEIKPLKSCCLKPAKTSK